jgi:hypothetical protein
VVTRYVNLLAVVKTGANISEGCACRRQAALDCIVFQGPGCSPPFVESCDRAFGIVPPPLLVQPPPQIYTLTKTYREFPGWTEPRPPPPDWTFQDVPAIITTTATPPWYNPYNSKNPYLYPGYPAVPTYIPAPPPQQPPYDVPLTVTVPAVFQVTPLVTYDSVSTIYSPGAVTVIVTTVTVLEPIVTPVTEWATITAITQPTAPIAAPLSQTTATTPYPGAQAPTGPYPTETGYPGSQAPGGYPGPDNYPAGTPPGGYHDQPAGPPGGVYDTTSWQADGGTQPYPTGYPANGSPSDFGGPAPTTVYVTTTIPGQPYPIVQTSVITPVAQPSVIPPVGLPGWTWGAEGAGYPNQGPYPAASPSGPWGYPVSPVQSPYVPWANPAGPVQSVPVPWGGVPWGGQPYQGPPGPVQSAPGPWGGQPPQSVPWQGPVGPPVGLPPPGPGPYQGGLPPPASGTPAPDLFTTPVITIEKHTLTIPEETIAVPGGQTITIPGSILTVTGPWPPPGAAGYTPTAAEWTGIAGITGSVAVAATTAGTAGGPSTNAAGSTITPSPESVQAPGRKASGWTPVNPEAPFTPVPEAVASSTAFFEPSRGSDPGVPIFEAVSPKLSKSSRYRITNTTRSRVAVVLIVHVVMICNTAILNRFAIQDRLVRVSACRCLVVSIHSRIGLVTRFGIRL